jgi:hypothetical protein
MRYRNQLVALATLMIVGGSTSHVAAQVSVDGVIYANFRYGLETDSSFSPPANPNNFDVVRSYINVRSKSEGGVSTRITADVDGRNADDDQLTFRLKYAYVGYQPEGSKIAWRFGLVPTPITWFIESIWGYRMQGSVAIDRTKYVRSSDFGVSMSRAWNDQAVNIDAGLFNGETYSKEPGDNRKDAAGRVSVRLAKSDVSGKSGGVRLTGFGSYGVANGGGTRQRFMGMLSYHSKVIRVGAEYTATDDDGIKGRVVSGWGVYNLPDGRLALIGRVDNWDPDLDIDPTGTDLATGTQTRVIAGVSYQLAPKVRLLVDADVLSAQGGEAGNAYDTEGRSLYFHTEVVF